MENCVKYYKIYAKHKVFSNDCWKVLILKRFWNIVDTYQKFSTENNIVYN